MSARDFYGALRGAGPAQMGMPSRGPSTWGPSGDSLGQGMHLSLPSFISGAARIGEVMGPWIAGDMRKHPGSVVNVGGKPMSMSPRSLMPGEGPPGSQISSAPMAFSGMYGNKDPQALNAMGFMQNYDRGRYAPWRGDIPYFSDPNRLAIAGGLY